MWYTLSRERMLTDLVSLANRQATLVLSTPF